jgi:transcriptional regulator with XRE-family HTH domain
MTPQQSIGQTIKQARESAGISRRALAKVVGKTHVTIANYERGSGAPPPETLAKIALTLGLTEFQVNGYHFQISESEGRPPKSEILQLKLDFDKEAVFPGATIKITPTRVMITIVATAPLSSVA